MHNFFREILSTDGVLEPNAVADRQYEEIKAHKDEVVPPEKLVAVWDEVFLPDGTRGKVIGFENGPGVDGEADFAIIRILEKGSLASLGDAERVSLVGNVSGSDDALHVTLAEKIEYLSDGKVRVSVKNLTKIPKQETE